MRINIFDRQLNKTLIVENNYKSCLWAEGYNSAQPFTLELANVKEYRDCIKKGYFAGRTDRKTIMVITGVQQKHDSLIITGKQATQILDNSAFIGTIPENSLVDKSVINAYNEGYKIPLLVFKPTNLPSRYDNQISNKSILQLSETMCKSTDTGIKVTKQGKQLVAEFYKPSETPVYTFSEDFGNLMINSIDETDNGFKNYAIVLGQGKSKERIRFDVDLTNGAERRELIVDARDIQQEEKETLENYKKRLKARGTEKLLEKGLIFKVDVTPNAREFNKVYDLGDVVKIRMREYGFNLVARIIKFEQKSQFNAIETKLTIGEIRKEN